MAWNQTWRVNVNVYPERSTDACICIIEAHHWFRWWLVTDWSECNNWLIVNWPLEAMFSEIVIAILQLKWLKNVGQCVISKASLPTVVTLLAHSREDLIEIIHKIYGSLSRDYLIETIYETVVTIMHLQLGYILFLSLFFYYTPENWKIVIFDVITFYFKICLTYVNTIEYVYFASYYIYIFIHANMIHHYHYRFITINYNFVSCIWFVALKLILIT